jgi:hypothetical protein
MNKKIENGNFDVDDILANTLFFENDRKNRGRKLKWDRAELRAAVAAVAISLRQDDVFKHGESNQCSEDHVALYDEEGRYVLQTQFIIATSPNRTAHGGALCLFFGQGASSSSRT